MTRPTVKGPELPTRLEPSEPTVLEHDAQFAEAELSHLNLRDQRARGVTFQGSKLVDIDLSSSELQDLSLLDVSFSGGNLANVRAHRGRVERTLLQAGRLTGLDLFDATLIDVEFRGCRIDLASFGSARLQRVSFLDCVMTQTLFLDARFDSVLFEDCDLQEIDFRGVRMSDCQLRRNDLTGMQGVEGLRGAAMAWTDIVEMAGVWATALGIEVLEAG
jgi:uncharacterized protein YjbI with pentapeptide repeats